MLSDLEFDLYIDQKKTRKYNVVGRWDGLGDKMKSTNIPFRNL